ncbi:MAG: hypothetical protein ABH827_02665 [bacterium]
MKQKIQPVMSGKKCCGLGCKKPCALKKEQVFKSSSMMVPAKKDQLAAFVQKEWGHEEWIVNNAKYCGKKMFLNKSYHCSMHCHKIKEETFYVISGKVLLELEQEDIKTKRILMPGDIQHIVPGLLHRFIGLEDSEIIEFSTFHMDEDSYRTSISGKIDLDKLDI